MFHILLGIFGGGCTPVQTAVNTRLRKAVGSPFRASMVSFTVGLATTLVIALCTGPYPLIPSSAWSGPWWMWLAGLFGVIFLTGNVLLLPHLGSMQTVLMPVLGQILAGLVIDQFGWFGTTVRPLTVWRALGAALVVAGFLVTVLCGSKDDALVGGATASAASSSSSPSIAASSSAPSSSAPHDSAFVTWMWRLAGIAFGACCSIQTAIFARLGSELGSPFKAAVASFVVGLLCLLVVVGVHDHSYSLAGAFQKGNPWWMWLGGILGACVVTTNAFLSPRLGTGLTVMLALFGQVAGGFIIDRFGLLGVPKRRVTALQLLGLAIVLGGIALIRLA